MNLDRPLDGLMDGPAAERLPCSKWPTDVNHLRQAAEELGDLTRRERDVLALVHEGLASREIAERLALSEATVYRVIADVLDALEYKPPGASADESYRRAGTRPASQTELTRLHQQFGSFDTDGEGRTPDAGGYGRGPRRRLS